MAINLRTNLALRYLPVTVSFGGSSNPADMPFLVDFDNNGAGFGGVAILEYDRGDFQAGVYAEVERGRWRLALRFEDVERYMVGNDYDLEVIYRAPAAVTPAAGALVFKNAVEDASGAVNPSDFDVYAVLTSRASGGGTPSTDSQTLSLAGTTLAISGGNSVDLAAILGTVEKADQTSITGTGVTGDEFAVDETWLEAQIKLKETKTTLVADVTAGTKLATYTDELGAAVDIYAPAASLVTIADAAASGNKIGTVTIDGTATDINETLTTVALAGTTLTHTDEAGTANAIDLTPAVKAAETQTTLDSLVLDPATKVLTATYTGENGTPQVKTVDMSTFVSGVVVEDITNFTWDSTTGVTTLEFLTTDGSTTTINTNIMPTFVNTDDQQLTGDTTGSVDLILTPVVVGGITNYTVKGDVKVDGTTITIDPTTKQLSAVAVPDVTTTMTGVQSSGKTIGTYSNELGAAVDVKETITSLALAGSTLTYTNEAGTATALTLPSGGGSTVTIANTKSTTSKLADLTINGATTAINETVTAMTLPAGATGRTIASYTNEAGVATAIFESITSMALSGNFLVYTAEGGAITSMTLPLPRSQDFTATAGQTAFTLSRSVISGAAVKIYRDGVRLPIGSVTAAGTTATYVPLQNNSEALLAGDRITIDYFS